MSGEDRKSSRGEVIGHPAGAEPQPSYAIGIDLGTTYSCVGVFRNNAVEIIANELGERTTPSYVAFTEDGSVLVGQAAKNQAAENPRNTIFDAKRLIGRAFSDASVQKDMLTWPFRVVNDNGKPVVATEIQGREVRHTPEQISAYVLAKMKQIAEAYLGCKVYDAVITVPAYFNDAQRSATKVAGELAGLRVRRIVNEPTAAAVAYGLGTCPNVSENENARMKANSNRVFQDEDSDNAMSDKDKGSGAGKRSSDEDVGDEEDLLAQFEASLQETLPNDTKQASTATGEAGEGKSTPGLVEVKGNKDDSSEDTDSRREKLILVFDLGGGTFDVSLLAVDGRYLEVRATAGDTHLGGEDFDQKIMAYVLSQFAKKHPELPPLFDTEGQPQNEHVKRALRRLRTASERAKRLLSSPETFRTLISIEDFWQGVSLEVPLTRARFEALCEKEFQRCLEPVKAVLRDTKLAPDRIDEIVLVGGSTRIPKIRQMIQDFFGGKAPNSSIHPDEAVAYGAAVQAAIVHNQAQGLSTTLPGSNAEAKDEDELLLVDVAPLSLGIETAGHNMSVFIKRNTTVPARVTRVYTTDEDNQTAVDIKIFEGERPSTKDNHFLGKVSLEGIPPAPSGVPRILVTFALDQDGILSVSAIEERSGVKCRIVITNENGAGRLTPEQVQQMLKEAEAHKLTDTQERQRQRALLALRTLCDQALGASRTLAPYIPERDLLKVLNWVEDLQAWIQVNSDRLRRDFDRKRRQMDAKFDSIFAPAFEAYKKELAKGGSEASAEDLSRKRKHEEL